MKSKLPFDVAPVRGSVATFRRGRRGIDHFVVSQSALSLFRQGHVARSWDTSDHWPLVTHLQRAAKVRAALHAVVAPRFRVNRELLDDMEPGVFSNHPLFFELLEEVQGAQGGQDENGLEEVVGRFHAVTKDVARDLGVVAQPGHDGRPHLLLQSATIRAIDRRRRRLREVVWAATPELARQAQEVYEAAVKRAKGMVRRDKARQWLKQLVKGAEAMRDKSRPRKVWDWIRHVTGKRDAASLVPAVRNTHGELVLDPAQILEVWADHYETLQTSAPPVAMRKGAGFWKRRLQLQSMGPLAPEVEQAMNAPLSWREVHRTITHMGRGKAGGASGIILELLLQAREYIPARFGARHPKRRMRVGTHPQTPFGKLIFGICVDMWEMGYIPDCLSEAMVTSLYKRQGDITDPDNYRGISLIEVLAKIVTTIVARRVAEAVEAAGRLRPEQAGFRVGEESIAQVVTLLEVCQRRTIKGLVTYIIFIDIKKAYDKVPHGALRAKLQAMGITGQALKMFDAIYRSAALRVRMACGESRRVTLLLGVRQGEPTSPIFFDIFFNDFRPAVTAGVGVAVPGMPPTFRVDGLDYADDASIFAEEGLPALQARLDIASEWAEANCQEFGIAKCGAMVVGGTPAQQAALVGSQLSLQGKVLPVVESYENLGITVSRDLDLEVTMRTRVEKGRRALAALLPFLSDRTIPVALKADKAIKALLHPVLTYGGEIFGMTEKLSRNLQRLLNKALRLVLMGGHRGKWCSPQCLMDEMHVFPIAAAAAGLRARALAKYRHSRTLIATLVKNPLGTRKATWVSGGRRWLRRYLPKLEGLKPGVDTLDLEAVLNSDSKELGRAVKRMVWRRQNARVVGEHVTYAAYVRQNMVATRAYIVNALRVPAVAVGIRDLMQTRCGAFVTAERAAGAGMIDIGCLDFCPFCMAEVPESLPHIFLKCPAWKGARKAHLRRLVKYIIPQLFRERGNGKRLSSKRMVTLLLGGSVGGVTLGGLWSGGRQFARQSAERSQEPHAFAVARFLQAIHRSRRSMLRNLRLIR